MEWNEDRLRQFWSHVARGEPDECWLWSGSTYNHGRYGRFNGVAAHRISCERANGPIPVGMNVMHTCDVGLCVNPRHLRVGSHYENMMDKARKLRVRTRKLVPEEVLAIRRLHSQGMTMREIRDLFPVGLTAVHAVINRKTFDWLS